jgi:hypothetical protein
MRLPDGSIRDVVECSPVIAAIETFELFRAYVDDDDGAAKAAVNEIVTDELGRKEDGRA